MNALEKIITEKSLRLNKYKSLHSVKNLIKKISTYNNFIDFKQKLKKESNKVSIIAEMKKA